MTKPSAGANFTWDRNRARHDFDRGRVAFWAQGGDQRIDCGVSDEALQDLNGIRGADPAALVTLFITDADRFAGIAERKWRRGLTEPDGSVLVRTSDL